MKKVYVVMFRLLGGAIRSFLPVSLLLLMACGESHEQMLRQLEELERMNRADSVMQNDSLARQLAVWFDRHGSSNERMRAHYMLGRTYSDMGEAPAALNAFLDAADAADTTATDCDYHTLSRVYGQMSIVFYRQNLMDDYLRACDRSADCAWRDHDTMHALYIEAHKVAAYNRLNQYDKAIATFDHAYEQLKQAFGVATAAKYCLLPVKSLIEKGHFDKAGEYLSLLERESGFFEPDGSIEKGREGYYYYKGRYLLAIGQPDSALYYFRKELQTGLDVTNQSMASRGLSLVYSDNGPQDSAIKYALYSYEMNDSVYAQMATKEVEQAKASYDYTRNQLLADKKTAEAQRTQTILILVSFLALSVFLLFAFVFVSYRKTQLLKIQKYQQILENLEKEQSELMELRAMEQISFSSLISRKDKTVEELQNKLASYRKKEMTRYADLENNLDSSNVVKRLRLYLEENPPREATSEDFRLLKNLINENIPTFYEQLKILRPIEYEICLLIRTHFAPAEISKLTGRTNDYITTTRKRIMKKVTGSEGQARELDAVITAIY